MDNLLSDRARASDRLRDIITRQHRLPGEMRASLDWDIDVLRKLFKTIQKDLREARKCMPSQHQVSDIVRNIKTNIEDATVMMTDIEQKLAMTERDYAEMKAIDVMNAHWNRAQARALAPNPAGPSNRPWTAPPRAESCGDLNRYSPVAFRSQSRLPSSPTPQACHRGLGCRSLALPAAPRRRPTLSTVSSSSSSIDPNPEFDV